VSPPPAGTPGATVGGADSSRLNYYGHDIYTGEQVDTALRMTCPVPNFMKEFSEYKGKSWGYILESDYEKFKVFLVHHPLGMKSREFKILSQVLRSQRDYNKICLDAFVLTQFD